ncbi:uracil-DNA glycosylase [Vaginisenegalia massiliensis]|uniref:uracil-DNA glycosylase n=1 Tax=Vaginisenegalia massiliensis TaxID=2058294 RepID=UPI001F14FFCB|nr:uracil-DNA glycosylase [Vaginisenegalia massiliensis]
MLTKYLNQDWQEELKPFIMSEEFQYLDQFVANAYKNSLVYPAKENIFKALNLVDYSKVKVCIVGQDPYHGPNQANGLAFGVQEGVQLPPSLRNIFKELNSDLMVPTPNSGDLTSWAQQGVLLLNRVLTVEAGKANSHQHQGWEKFTQYVIQALAARADGVVFVLWGKPAQQLKPYIQGQQHLIIESVHPSPLAAYRGFFGSRPFSQINHYLQEKGLQSIDWSLS